MSLLKACSLQRLIGIMTRGPPTISGLKEEGDHVVRTVGSSDN
jgi:hypothetical protein